MCPVSILDAKAWLSPFYSTHHSYWPFYVVSAVQGSEGVSVITRFMLDLFSTLKVEAAHCSERGKFVRDYLAWHPGRFSSGGLNSNRAAFDMSDTSAMIWISSVFSAIRMSVHSCAPVFNRPTVPQHVTGLSVYFPPSPYTTRHMPSVDGRPYYVACYD
jgi:hypothetical protein